MYVEPEQPRRLEARKSRRGRPKTSKRITKIKFKLKFTLTLYEQLYLINILIIIYSYFYYLYVCNYYV